MGNRDLLSGQGPLGAVWSSRLEVGDHAQPRRCRIRRVRIPFRRAICGANRPATGRPDRSSGKADYRPHTRDPARATQAAAFVAHARAKGRLRVIARLDLTLQDETKLTAARRAMQRGVLIGMQDEVVRRSLPGIAPRRVVRFEFIPFMSVLVNASQLQRLIADPNVVTVAEDIPMQPLLDGSTVKIQARKLWQKRIDGRGTVIAVLDGGVDPNHNMLLDKIVAEACFSSVDRQVKSRCARAACPRRSAAAPGDIAH